MDRTVSDPNFAGMAVFTPVINGEFLYTLVLQLLETLGKQWTCPVCFISGSLRRFNSLLVVGETWGFDSSFTAAWLPLVPAFHQRVTGLGCSLLPKRHVFQQKLSSFPDSSRLVEDPHLPIYVPCGTWRCKDLDLQLRVRKSNCFWYKAWTSFLPNEPGKCFFYYFLQ